MDLSLAQFSQQTNFASERAGATPVTTWHCGTTIAVAAHVGTDFKPYAQRPKEMLH